MDAQDELNREPSLEAEAGRATDGDAQPAESRNDAVEKPAGAAEPLAAAPRSQEAEGNAPTIEPPRLHLIPYAAPRAAEAAGGPPAALAMGVRARRRLWR